jgi:hypothetical protein
MSYESLKYCIGDLYAGIIKNAQNHQIFMSLYACIIMNVKTSDYYGTYMRFLQ